MRLRDLFKQVEALTTAGASGESPDPTGRVQRQVSGLGADSAVVAMLASAGADYIDTLSPDKDVLVEVGAQLTVVGPDAANVYLQTQPADAGEGAYQAPPVGAQLDTGNGTFQVLTSITVPAGWQYGIFLDGAGGSSAMVRQLHETPLS